MGEDKNKEASAENTQEGDAKKEEQQANSEKEEESKTPAQEPAKEMKAIVLTGFGGLKSVKIMKKPEPSVEKGKILIRVKACGLNFLDVLVRQGVVNNLPKTPFIMGFECAGEVEAVGEEVSGFQVGDVVAALPESQAWAELALVPATHVYKLPAGLAPKEAAGMLLNYVAAYILVHDLAGLRSGGVGGPKTVLVHSAGGAVGLALAQLAKLAAPDVILVGIASKHKHEHIKDHFTHLLDHGSDYVAEVKKISPTGVDVVLDSSSGDDTNKGHSMLKPMGKYIIYGTSSLVSGETKSLFSFAKSWWQVDKVNPLKLYDENKSLAGFHLRHLLFKQDGHEYVRQVVDKVLGLWSSGSISSPIVDSTWAFEDVTEAMQKLHDRKNVGKIVLDPAMEPKPKPQAPTPRKITHQISLRKMSRPEKVEKKSKKGDKEVKAASSVEEPSAAPSKTEGEGDVPKDEAKDSQPPAEDAAAAAPAKEEGGGGDAEPTKN